MVLFVNFQKHSIEENYVNYMSFIRASKKEDINHMPVKFNMHSTFKETKTLRNGKNIQYNF